jgi:hypothetical protein
LLLDTICNTFGGVVFIAILVIVLLQMTSTPQLDAPPDPPQQEELVALETQRDEVNARLKSLREAVTQQEALFGSIANSDDLSLAARLKELQSRCGQLNDDRMKSLGQISQSQIKTNEVAAQLASLEQTLKDAPTKVTALEAELQRELAERTEDARLPIQRDTDKREMPFLLTTGKLHSVYLVRGDGTIVFNSGECATAKSLGVEEVTAKPGTGVLVEQSDASRKAISERLANLESDGDYLAVFVWPDSFPQFRFLKDLLVSKNFEYRLVPMTTNGKVYRGGAATAKPKVQ